MTSGPKHSFDIFPGDLGAALLTLDTALQGSARDKVVTASFINMNNFNVARASSAARQAFDDCDYVFADGVAMQIARRAWRAPPFRRISGTDLVPVVLARSAQEARRIFLLGGRPEVIDGAAASFKSLFPGLSLAGFHHGFFAAEEEAGIANLINDSHPDILLVGMGTPLQELWLQRWRHALNARLAICVGGLFHYWSRDLLRAPWLMRRCGFEWLWILGQQPQKWRHYLLGSWRFFLNGDGFDQRSRS